MTEAKSQVGFVLMEPAFLRVLLGETRPKAVEEPSPHGAPRALVDAWKLRWSALAAQVSTRHL